MSGKEPVLATTLRELEEAAAEGAAIDLAGLAAAVEKLCADTLAAPQAERAEAAAGLAVVVSALDRLDSALKQQQDVSAKAAHRRASAAYKS
jgi:hypothetical protein